jgi:hypothetical protein
MSNPGALSLTTISDQVSDDENTPIYNLIFVEI